MSSLFLIKHHEVCKALDGTLLQVVKALIKDKQVDVTQDNLFFLTLLCK